MKKKISLVILLLVQIACFSQMHNYRFKRPISGIENQWHKIKLPEEVFRNLQSDVAQPSDLRIYGVTETNDTVEAPYLINIQKKETKTKDVSLKVLNQSYKSDRYFVTLNVPSGEPINSVHLNFDQNNFDWKIKIEGSNDQNEWFEIANDKRVVSIQQPNMKYAFTDVSFGESQYKYYRLSFKSDKDVKLNSATTSLLKTTQGNSKKQSINIEVNEDKKGRITLVDMEFDEPTAIHKLSLQVADQFDYYRRISIEYAIGSLGDSDVYGHLYSGVLSSVEPADFEFRRTMVKKLRVYVYNNDNQPLRFLGADAQRYEVELIARFTEKASYYLVYGSEKMPAPNYDIARFKDKIPKQLSELTLGAAGASGVLSEKIEEPLFKNKAWLWGIMVFIILLLGWFTFGMLKKAEE